MRDGPGGEDTGKYGDNKGKKVDFLCYLMGRAVF